MSALDRLDAMLKAGVPYETALELARGFEADVEAAVLRGAQAVAASIRVDPKAEARKEKDRARKRKVDVVDAIPRNSKDSTEFHAPLSEGPQGSLSPEPPNLPNPPNLTLEPPISPTKSAQKPVRGAFERFWAEYPLKVGKRKAEDAYGRAWRRCETDDPEAEMLDGLKRCKPLWEPEFIPHPTTWLNRDGWLDQLTPDLPDSTGPPRFDLAAFERERAERQRQLEEGMA